MGIDKPDVRVVVHIDLPESPEAYFQEAGRGGRDGKKSFVALLWNEDDVKQLEYSINNNFSSVDEVKRVYAALMNYLQIAVGSGNMQSFDFDLVDFTDKFNLQPTQVLKAFKVLEQHDYITLTDGAVLPARVMITLTRENLYRYEVEHKQSEPILKLLLRMHEGIKDQYCTVSEKRIAAELKMQVNDVIAQLKIMSKNEVLDYLPAKEKPQIILNTFCHKADDIELNVSNMNKLKAMQQQRIAAMVDYVTNNDVCRNVLLLNYFGENDAIPCGKCDICIEQKKKNYSAEKLMNIFNQLKENFSYHEFTLTEATNFISTASTNEISYMLEWLHSEHKIKYQNGKFKIQAWQ
jgi:ATP-dependent DNA helicase RecQ